MSIIRAGSKLGKTDSRHAPAGGPYPRGTKTDPRMVQLVHEMRGRWTDDAVGDIRRRWLGGVAQDVLIRKGNSVGPSFHKVWQGALPVHLCSPVLQAALLVAPPR